MKQIITFLALLLLFPAIVNAFESNEMRYFSKEGCSYCAKVEDYFTRNNLYETFHITTYEISNNKENARLLNTLYDGVNVPISERKIPVLFLDDNTPIIGDKSIISYFEGLTQGGQDTNQKTPSISTSLDLTLPVVILGALVDAINPCEFAVLIILLSTTAITIRDKVALKSGLAFSLAIFLSYSAMGVGLYKALTLGTLPQFFLKAIGVLAVILGLLNMKDFFWYGKGVLMEVPLSWRPRLKALILSVTSPLGAFLVGFLVSLFLLPCTSGPYIVILGLLAEKATRMQATLYLLLYNLIFVSPMVLITLLVYFGLSPEQVEAQRQKRIKILHLIAGVLLLLMGFSVLLGLL
ncbi:MAG TPA: cytochrome c biogenesis protein CcdA [Patescibacteria group bacterium]|nr:cytochrome c biogenesis protein CcdA [Patescibacteria group bacterium]